MVRLLLLRHAKAERQQPGQTDAERPLDARGRDQAARMGRLLATRDWRPDRILCSPARRTRETLDIALAELGAAPDIRFVPALFEKMNTDYLDTIRSHGDGAGALLVVGHNPATHETALSLAASDGSQPLERMREGFPTAALAVLEIEAGFDRLSERGADLIDFIRPKDLDAFSSG